MAEEIFAEQYNRRCIKRDIAERVAVHKANVIRLIAAQAWSASLAMRT